MPRDGAGVFTVPAGTDGVPNATIGSSPYNKFVHDVEADLNTPRPIVAGGSGAASAAGALTNLGAEQNNAIVTNYDTQAWVSGSFSSATSATNPPVASRRFAGIAYVADPNNIVLEARDLDSGVAPGPLYIRQKNAGVWGPWTLDAGFYANIGLGQCYLWKSGANLILTPEGGNRITINSTAQTIPDAGVSLAPAGNASNTFYYIYVYMNSGVMTLEFSTTGYVIQAGTGVKIKSGDATRSLVGLASSYVSNGLWSTYVTDVCSLFNPKDRTHVSPTVTASTTSAILTPIAAALNIQYVTFADREVLYKIYGRANQTVSAAAIYLDAINDSTLPYVFQNLQGASLTSQPYGADGNWDWMHGEVSFFAAATQKHAIQGAYCGSTGTVTFIGGNSVTIRG